MNRMKYLLDKIDAILCKYIGISDNEITPNYIKKFGSQLLISNTESFKRHLYVYPIKDFFTNDFKMLNYSNQQKVGLAIGKALAKNLVVSFDNIHIKENG